MIRILFLSGLAALCPLTGWSADTPPAPAIDIAARKDSIAQLETHISQREQRLAEWARDIVAIDARIEKHTRRAGHHVGWFARLPGLAPGSAASNRIH